MSGPKQVCGWHSATLCTSKQAACSLPRPHHTPVNITSHLLLTNKRDQWFPGPQVDTCYLRQVPLHNEGWRYKTTQSMSVSVAGPRRQGARRGRHKGATTFAKRGEKMQIFWKYVFYDPAVNQSPLWVTQCVFRSLQNEMINVAALSGRQCM